MICKLFDDSQLFLSGDRKQEMVGEKKLQRGSKWRHISQHVRAPLAKPGTIRAQQNDSNEV